MLSWQVCGCDYTGFTGEKSSFCHQAPIPKFTKTCFPAASELCEDTTRTQCDIPSEKRLGESVLWVLTAIPAVTLMRWKCTTHDFQGRSVKQLVSFRKLKILTKAVVVMKSKVNQCVFLACLGCNYPAFIGGKYRFFSIMAQCPGSQKCFLAVSEFCKDKPRTQCTNPREKMFRESVLWVFIAIPIVTLISGNSFVRWVPSRIGK